MPTVKQYQRQVEPRPMPDGRQTVPASTPESGGAAIGEAFYRVGSEIFHEEIRRQDAIAVMEAERKLSQWENSALYDPQRGALTSIRGKESLGIQDVIEKGFTEQATVLRGQLGSQRQRAAFDRAVAVRAHDIRQSVSRHVFQEMRKFDDNETASYIKNARNAAVANYKDTARVMTEIERQEAAVTDYAARNGMGGDYVKDKRAEVRSQTHRDVIERMVANGQDRQAAAYLDAVRGEIAGDDLTNVEKWVEEGSTRGEGQRAADRILGEATTRVEALNKAREIEDPKVRDAAEERVQRYWSIKQQAESEEQEQIMSHIAGGLDRGGNLSQVLPSMWNKLDAAQRSAMRSYEKQIAAGNKPVTDIQTYYDLVSLASSPETQEAFIRTNLLAYRHKLDDEDFKHLATVQAALRKGDTKQGDKLLSDARTQNQIVDDALLGLGLDPTPSEKTSESQREKILAFRRAVRQAVAAHQAKTQKEITNDELQTIVDGLVIKGTTEKGILWDTKKHVFELKPGESIAIKAADVPQEERNKIEDALRRAGRAVTDEAIVSLYQARLGRMMRAPDGVPQPPQPGPSAPPAPKPPSGTSRLPVAPETPKPTQKAPEKSPEKIARPPAHDFRRPSPKPAQDFSGRTLQPQVRDKDIDRAVKKAPVNEAEKKRIVAQINRLTPQARDGKRTEQQRTATMREIINLLRQLDIPDTEIEKAIRRPIRSLE